MRLDAPCIGLPNALCLAIPRYTDWIAWPIIVSCEMRICSLAGRPARNWMGYCGLILRGEVQLDRMLKTIRVRVRHQNSVFRIFTNFDSRLRIKKFVFLIRITQINVRFTHFKIRLNIGLDEYINTVWRNTKCCSKIGGNRILKCCLSPSILSTFSPSQQQVPSDRVPCDTWRRLRE